MSCPAPDRVLDYLAHTLDARERDEIDAHVDTCSTCRELLVELVRTDSDDMILLASTAEPTTIGRYVVGERLGDGGMGTVYAAHDPQLDRRVAIKLMHPEVRGGIERLVREGRTLAKLSHPNVVAIYDAGSDGDRVYIAMELVEGTTLAEWLRTPRTTRRILEQFVAAARGIAAAHALGIVHRDVKPENVLIDHAGHVKVADFGLAADEEPASRLTRPGIVLGTPLYMSPEQRRGAVAGKGSDQYSFCVALETALAGRRVPASVRRALARGKSAMPADRFSSFDALVAAIDPVRRARRMQWGVGALAVATAAAIAVVALRGSDGLAATCETLTARPRVVQLDRGRLDSATALYADGLTFAGHKLCEHRPESADARAVFDLATTCLVERRTSLAALFYDPRLTVARVHDLLPVEDCQNPASLVEEHAARATPDGLARRAALSQAMRSAPSAQATGAFEQATADVHVAVALGRTFGGVILAKALLAYAQIAGPIDGFPAVESAMREAIVLAEVDHADALHAFALAMFAAALAREPGHERETLTLQPIAESAIRTAGKQEVLGPVLDQAVGTAQLRLGRNGAALESFSAALAIARRVLPPDDARLPEYIYPVGVALGMMRRDAEAATLHAEAYAVASKIWGADHPNAVRFEINLAIKHGALNDCTTAMREATHARKVLTGVLPASSEEHLLIDELMGSCYGTRHESEAALREHALRQDALRAAGGDHTVEMAESWVDIGDVELDRKRYDDALRDYTLAVTMDEQLVGRDDPRIALPMTRVGEAELALGHRDQAIAALERAVWLYQSAVPVVAADAHFALARALWSNPKTRERAEKLLGDARAAYVAGGAQFATRVAEIDAWSHAHP